ncbi:MAG: hypothetical protein QW350_05655 [Candidatus Aenigmatarchaeota archaeon]
MITTRGISKYGDSFIFEVNSNGPTNLVFDISDEEILWDNPRLKSFTINELSKRFNGQYKAVSWRFELTSSVDRVPIKNFPAVGPLEFSEVNSVNVNDDNLLVYESNNSSLLSQLTFRFPQCTSCGFSIFTGSIYIKVVIELTIDCTSNFFSSLCTSLCQCTDKNYCQVCFQAALKNCFPNPQREECVNFLTDYMTFSGPNQDLDQKLTEYCSKYHNYSEAIEDPYCPCHLPESYYDDILNKLSERFENIDKAIIQKHCVLPQCALSSFPDSSIGTDKCKGVHCINIIEFDDKNNIKNVEIDQSGGQNCINIRPKNSSLLLDSLSSTKDSEKKDVSYLLEFIVILSIIIGGLLRIFLEYRR